MRSALGAYPPAAAWRRTPAHTLVPLIDMANHVPSPAVAAEGQGEQESSPQGSNTEIRSGSDGEVAMWAKRKVRAVW